MFDNELSKNFEKSTGIKFDTFYNKYRTKLVLYLYGYTKNREMAEDFANEAFIQALLKINTFIVGKASLQTWVYKIGENIVKKNHNDSKKLPIHYTENDTGYMALDELDVSHKILRQEKEIVAKVSMVEEAITMLPEKYKEVMVLRELKKKSYNEIADICLEE